jgi:hypothetical protein
MYRVEPHIWETVFLWVAAFPSTTPSRADTNVPIIQVATTSCPPFVIVDGGSFCGLSIFLWDEIARGCWHGCPLFGSQSVSVLKVERLQMDQSHPWLLRLACFRF